MAEAVALRERIDKLEAAIDFARSAIDEALAGRAKPEDLTAISRMLGRVRGFRPVKVKRVGDLVAEAAVEVEDAVFIRGDGMLVVREILTRLVNAARLA